jgi:hypothetical protein
MSSRLLFYRLPFILSFPFYDNGDLPPIVVNSIFFLSKGREYLLWISDFEKTFQRSTTSPFPTYAI